MNILKIIFLLDNTFEKQGIVFSLVRGVKNLKHGLGICLGLLFKKVGMYQLVILIASILLFFESQFDSKSQLISINQIELVSEYYSNSKFILVCFSNLLSPKEKMEILKIQSIKIRWVEVQMLNKELFINTLEKLKSKKELSTENIQLIYQAMETKNSYYLFNNKYELLENTQKLDEIFLHLEIFYFADDSILRNLIIKN